jgi:hypothetical protein
MLFAELSAKDKVAKCHEDEVAKRPADVNRNAEQYPSFGSDNSGSRG